MTVTVVGYLILISIGFYDLFSPFSPESFSFFFCKIYRSLKTVFDHDSKHLKVRQKIIRYASYFQLCSRVKFGQALSLV